MAGRFVDNRDGTVTDNCTGLMWQKETAPDEYTWQQALQYCEGLELAGHSDWRLPNVQELHSILDYDRRGPATDPIFGANLRKVLYWSSTTFGYNSNDAWGVNLDDGGAGYSREDLPWAARAVRGGL